MANVIYTANIGTRFIISRPRLSPKFYSSLPRSKQGLEIMLIVGGTGRGRAIQPRDGGKLPVQGEEAVSNE